VRQVMALAFLHPDRVQARMTLIEKAYRDLPPVAPVMVAQVRPDLDVWFAYVRKNYVDQQLVARREYWSVHDTDSHRTNNNLEGFHCELRYHSCNNTLPDVLLNKHLRY
jgi:hypothetical protein